MQSLLAKFRVLLFVALCCNLAGSSEKMLASELWQQPQPAQYGYLQLRVVDQNGIATGAKITVQRDDVMVSSSEMPAIENSRFQLLPGTYKILVEKQGFYSVTAEKITITASQTTPLEVHLQDVRTHSEEVEVAAQSSPIDPQQTAASHTITGEDITNIPYPSTRDYRNILRFLPGVITDNGGTNHVAGGGSQQTEDYLDGFEISQPTGGLGVRLNPDSLRQINVETSRYSAQFGKGSAGFAAFETYDGNNQFHFNATDFFPTFQFVKGFHFNNWTPRASFSGPIKRNKAWFLLSHEGENDLNIIDQLPDGQDTSRVWRTADLAKLRVNLSPSNVLMMDGIIDLFNSEHAGLSIFNPVGATVNQKSGLHVLGVKDQISFAKDSLVEFGFGFLRAHSTEVPLGLSPEFLTPDGIFGNFYRSSSNASDRIQGFSNVFLHPVSWHGTHQFVFGGAVDRVDSTNLVVRKPLIITDVHGATVREILYQNAPAFTLHSVEPSAYFQDRWSPLRGLILDAGLRWDADTFIDRHLFSPRLAGTYLLHKASETKLSAGIGIYYDRSNLSVLSRTRQGSRTDFFFADDGSFTHAPFATSFVVDPDRLLMPRFTNWSAGIERRMPAHIYARVDYLNRSGKHGWGFEDQLSGVSPLENNREDRYHSVQLTLRREIKRGYPVLVSYTRSSARTNEVLDFGQDNPIFSNQISGPLLWDAPNHVVSWGFLPLPSFWKFKKFELAYSTIWHSGFPFITIDQFQQLVDGPGAHRFPHYFTLNPALEKKFNFRGYRWALRAGFDNITGSKNPTFVDNNVNSTNFLALGNFGHRSFNGRIRLIGPK